METEIDWKDMLLSKYKPKTRRERKREEELTRTPIPKPRPGEQYLGPTPIGWAKLASQVGAGDLTTPLWHKAVLKKSGTFQFNASFDAEEGYGIPHSSATRKLHALEDAGLIKLDNLNGRPPWVTLLQTPKEKA